MFHFIFLLPVLKREKGGKGKAEPLKPIFLLISVYSTQDITLSK